MRRITVGFTACVIVAFLVFMICAPLAAKAQETQQKDQPGENQKSSKTGGETSGQTGDASKGETVFQQKCVACHTIGGGKKIGPDLKGVTEKRPHDWLVNFISDPEKMYKENDPTATALLKEYNNVKMPNSNLSKEQVNDVIAYMESKGGEAKPAPGETEKKSTK